MSMVPEMQRWSFKMKKKGGLHAEGNVAEMKQLAGFTKERQDWLIDLSVESRRRKQRWSYGAGETGEMAVS